MFEVMGHGVLGQKRRLQADFRSDPFAFGVRSVGRMVAASSASELRAEVRALDLIELANFTPSGIADGSRDVDLEFQERHEVERVPSGAKAQAHLVPSRRGYKAAPFQSNS